MKAQTKQLTWMEFDVIRWQNSPSVLKMSLEAKGAYFGLICSEWVRGPLPNDPEVLWQYAGAKSPADFDRVKDVVLAKFKVSQDGQFLSNDTVQEKREKALELIAHRSELRSKAGKKGAAAKWQNKQSDGKCHTEEVHQKDGKNGKTMAPGMANDGNQQDLQDLQDIKTLTATAVEKTGGAKKATPKETPDPRHTPIKDHIFKKHRQRYNMDPSWDGAEGGALGNWLKANPTAELGRILYMVNNVYASDCDTGRPCTWLHNLDKWANNPIDGFRKPKPTSTNGTGKTLSERTKAAMGPIQ